MYYYLLFRQCYMSDEMGSSNGNATLKFFVRPCAEILKSFIQVCLKTSHLFEIAIILGSINGLDERPVFGLMISA